MKKLLIVFTIIGSVYTTNSFAQDQKPALVVLQSFQNAFSGAANISWSDVQNLYKAAFTLNGENVSAFFNNEGSLVAFSRNLTVLQLPLSLQAALQKNYQNDLLADLFEVDNGEGTTYYATVQHGNTQLQLKSLSYGEWSVYHKTRI